MVLVFALTNFQKPITTEYFKFTTLTLEKLPAKQDSLAFWATIIYATAAKSNFPDDCTIISMLKPQKLFYVPEVFTSVNSCKL